MTRPDPTDLAKRLLAAARGATPGEWSADLDIDTSSKPMKTAHTAYLRDARQHLGDKTYGGREFRAEDAEYIALANPANVTRLADAYLSAIDLNADAIRSCKSMMTERDELRADNERLRARVEKRTDLLRRIQLVNYNDTIMGFVISKFLMSAIDDALTGSEESDNNRMTCPECHLVFEWKPGAQSCEWCEETSKLRARIGRAMELLPGCKMDTEKGEWGDNEEAVSAVCAALTGDDHD